VSSKTGTLWIIVLHAMEEGWFLEWRRWKKEGRKRTRDLPFLCWTELLV